MSASLRSVTDTCRICRCATNKHKPYCIDHLDYIPYVKDLQAQIASRNAETGTVGRKGWRAVDPNGSRAREIVDQLAKGAQTPKRLAIVVEINPTSLESYLVALERAGLVKTQKLGSRRGGTRRVVALVEEIVESA